MSPEAINLKTLREAINENDRETVFELSYDELAALIDVAEAATKESASQGFCILCESDLDAPHFTGCSLARFTTGENE